ncbi:MAG: LCP family protein, partial [Firmicutes bacterium]|nr:LCP family protein [Bacillota bacterium]
ERKTRINEAFSVGGKFKMQGFENTMDTVEVLLGGIPVNYYMAVDMTVVKEIIDITGGLYYDVDIHVKICGREVQKGYQKLTGQQALDYARVRKGYGTDIARMDRQQRIVMAVVEQLKERGKILKIPEYYDAISEKSYTNLSTEQLAALALFANKLDLEESMDRHTVPTVGLPLIDKKSMLGIKQKEFAALVKEIYGVDIPIDYEMDGETIRANKTR